MRGRLDLRGARGQTAAEYMGVLLLVAVIVGAVAMSSVGDDLRRGIETAICRIAGGDCEAEKAQAEPERCLVSSTETASSATVLIAVVKVDKDSTLIRENYSDGTSRFVILDNSEVAGEVYAGVKAKIDEYGVNYSASADAGLALAGARVFEMPNQEAADAFQEQVEAAGGFDGILRDLAGYNDEIPFVGWDNPFGGLDDAALDLVGVGDDEDLPEPTETYVEGKAFLDGNAEAGMGIGIANAEIKALLEGSGAVKYVTSGENEGDVEFTVALEGDASGSLTAASLGGGGAVDAKFTATISLDAQNGYEPDELELRGSAGYVGSLDLKADLEGDALADVSEALDEVSLSSTAGDGQGIEVGATLDLNDRANLDALLATLANRPGGLAELIEAIDEEGTISLDTYDVTKDETEGEIKVGLGVGGGVGGSSSEESQTGRDGIVRAPGGTFQPRVCKQPPS